MKKIFPVVFVALTLLNCKNKEQKNESTNPVEETVTVETTKPITLDKGCYVYNANNSMITLEITENEEAISGNLTYALAEKDKNTGTFKGQLKEDILIGNYTFQSEGVESVREVAFKLDGEQLFEGYGEMVVEGSKASFKDTSTINYMATMSLTKTDCGQ